MVVADVDYSGSAWGTMGVKVARDSVSLRDSTAITIGVERDPQASPASGTTHYRVCWQADAGARHTLFIWDEPGGGGDVTVTTLRPQ